MYFTKFLFLDNIVTVNFVEISASVYEGQTVVLSVERDGWIATPLLMTVRVVELDICLYGSGKLISHLKL